VAAVGVCGGLLGPVRQRNLARVGGGRAAIHDIHDLRRNLWRLRPDCAQMQVNAPAPGRLVAVDRVISRQHECETSGPIRMLNPADLAAPHRGSCPAASASLASRRRRRPGECFSGHDDRLILAQSRDRFVGDVEVRLDKLRRGERQPLVQ
jgi:hypothetical protein